MNSRQGLSDRNSSVPQWYAQNQEQRGPNSQPQHSYATQQDQQQQNLYWQSSQQYHDDEPPPPRQPPRPPQYQPREQSQRQNQRHGPLSSDPAAPALPPRPTGTTNRLMAQSTLSFPPPPRSPNKPPELPPRPNQAAHGATKRAPCLPQQLGCPTSASIAQSLPQACPSHGRPHDHFTPPSPENDLACPSVEGITYHPPRPGTPPLSQRNPPGVTASLVQLIPHYALPADSHLSQPPTSTDGLVERSSQYTSGNPAVGKLSSSEQQARPPSPGTSSTSGHTNTCLRQSKPTVEPLPHHASGIRVSITEPGVSDERHLSRMIERLDLQPADARDPSSTLVESNPSMPEVSGKSPNPPLHPNIQNPRNNAQELVSLHLHSSAAFTSVISPSTNSQLAYVADAHDKARCKISSASGTLSPLMPATEPLEQDGKFTEGGANTELCGSLLEQQCVGQIQSIARDESAFGEHPVSAAFRKSVQSPTECSPDSHQKTTPLPSLPSRQSTTWPLIRPVTHCIDTPVTFSTWWYLHDSAPDSPICSKCYMDNIHPTAFQAQFSARYFSDGTERRCRFNVPRIIDQLLPDAVSRGSLDTLVLFMNQRMHIPDCRGVDGAAGSECVKWFSVRNNQIPGFVVCEACYQDVVCMSQFAFNFEQCLGQAGNDTWACDMCVPFIRKEFELRTRNDDWPSFINEAKARIGMPTCPKNTPISFSIRKWFVPVKGQGPPDAVLCVACYCDYILKSGQEHLWQQEKQDLLHATKTTNTCMSGMFHLRMALTAADENKDWPLFWSVLNRIAYLEKPCIGDGIVNGNWYTLPSQPVGYNVCGACHAGVLQSLHLENVFVQRSSNAPTPDEPHLCAFNTKTQRFVSYLRLMLQTWFTADCTAWDAYARRCAAVPTCPRNQDFKNRSWYGWPECVICADCYVDFVHGTTLDTPKRMPFNTPVVLEAAHICEMYSPRMRQLYEQACQDSPPRTEALFSQVELRRLVYWQTIPHCRQLLMEEKFLANKISMARMSSVFYNAAGGIAAVGRNHHYTYGAAGVGYGYSNALQLTGAQYNAEANAMSTQLGGNKILIVGQLEQRWLAVE